MRPGQRSFLSPLDAAFIVWPQDRVAFRDHGVMVQFPDDEVGRAKQMLAARSSIIWKASALLRAGERAYRAGCDLRYRRRQVGRCRRPNVSARLARAERKLERSAYVDCSCGAHVIPIAVSPRRELFSGSPFATPWSLPRPGRFCPKCFSSATRVSTQAAFTEMSAEQ
jgi:hypothetical protein